MKAKLNVPHPIPYQGSKRALAPLILRYFPQQIERLVEPFAGSAAISLAAAQHGIPRRLLINDAHAPLADLWREIIERPDALAKSYARLWNKQLGQERAYYDQVRAEFNRTHQPHLFLYLLARCVKACIRYNSAGEFNNSPDNRRLGAAPAAMRSRINGAAQLLQDKTEVSSHDYTAVLAECSRDDLIYMDPPYQGVSGDRDSRYAPSIGHDAFCESLAELNRRRIKFLVSYDGRTGDKRYGEPLSASLGLTHLEIRAGRSTQATLLGRNEVTYESLYLSPALARSFAKQNVGVPSQRSLAFE